MYIFSSHLLPLHYEKYRDRVSFERTVFLMLVLCAVFIILLFCVWLLLNPQSQKKSQNSCEKPSPNTPAFDSQNPPDSLSADQREFVKKVADYCQTRYISQADLQRYNVHVMSELFSAMPGWSIWDSSIHEAKGQYARMERATAIKVLCYSPYNQLAKIQGNTGVYLTSYKRCSCPDYRYRHLPCKHIYALAMELDGDDKKQISDDNHSPLSGLTFALAGRFHGGRNNPDGIRKKIESLGGAWVDDISRGCSALVTGHSPSATKISRAEELDMEIIPSEAIDSLFSLKNDTAVQSEADDLVASQKYATGPSAKTG
jgi:hypothetical protein